MYSKPPPRFAGMDPMDMAKAAALERRERRETMEQAEKDIEIVQQYLRNVADLLEAAADNDHSPNTGVMHALWARQTRETIANLSGAEVRVVKVGITLDQAANTAGRERSKDDGQDVPDADGSA